MKAAQPHAKARAQVDTDDRVISDLLCVKCGWNLRSYLVSDPCPTCGHPVSDSVYGDYLIHTDTAQVRRLADAARLVQFGAVLLGGLVLVMMLVTVKTRWGRGIALAEDAFRVLLFGAMIAPVPAAVGMVMLTPRRTLAYYRAWFKRRYASRASRTLLGTDAIIVLTVLTAGFTLYAWVATRLAMVLWFGIPLAMFFRGVEQLMRRLPSASLARFSRAIFVATIIFSVFAFGVLLLERISTVESGVEELRIVMTAICDLAGLVIGFGAVRLLVRVRAALSSAAR